MSDSDDRPIDFAELYGFEQLVYDPALISGPVTSVQPLHKTCTLARAYPRVNAPIVHTALTSHVKY